ncbi:hypothetical protein T06_1442 [Trichinella sp. T6]|uniref:Uncharacterized protein n=1 Tax=Trichinella murrelli TaxID=144512 RepID=A0A0V0SZV4_9BILA|nr:hypothetical protein T05_7718 [Trichinella murrelli]KRX34139.1 hypothetical protein T06_1442 [Trichinella sp. T6]
MLSYQTWALSSLNANLSAISICLLLSLCANDVRRMNNGAFNAMTDEEDH